MHKLWNIEFMYENYKVIFLYKNRFCETFSSSNITIESLKKIFLQAFTHKWDIFSFIHTSFRKYIEDYLSIHFACCNNYDMQQLSICLMFHLWTVGHTLTAYVVCMSNFILKFNLTFMLSKFLALYTMLSASQMNYRDSAIATTWRIKRWLKAVLYSVDVIFFF